MLSLPFALVGGFWLIWLLGHNLSVASAVGFIALSGLAAEFGVVMLVYLRQAIEKHAPSTDAELPEFHTIDGGHRVFAQNVEKRRLGAINQNMTLAIRPEQVTMTLGTSRPEDNLLRGMVTQIKFRGATSLIEFDAEGLKLETCVMKTGGIKVGDECMLGLPPHRIIILKN